jgi:UDP-N-acetylmuramoyl-L-alanyl-D-glutamate--2,6-diaminopimelate ligase
MRFSALLDGVEVLSLVNPADLSIRGVQYDSRKVLPGECFVAMKGDVTDGNRFIDSAIAAGAVAVVSDSAQESPRASVAWAQVSHGRRALGVISGNFYQHPARKLAVTGVTGTNGKTTVTHLLESVLTAAGRTSALVGTIEYRIAGHAAPAPHTTPESLELNRFFAQALEQKASEAVMEVSSHALHQQRVFGIPFDVAVFTNLTQDHLDYHPDMESYFASKCALFEGCGTQPPRVSVINIDDPYGRRLLELARKSGSEVLTYGNTRGDFHTKNVTMGPQGSRFDLVTPAGEIAIFTPLIGRVNVLNVLAASAAAHARGCSLAEISRGVQSLTHVPGRFQRVDMGQPFTVVVDYAHTDDALRNLTTVARDFLQQRGGAGRIITVFGCGGDRDRKKRPLMAEAAAKGSDISVLTSDNPRSEDPLAIIHDALIGLLRSGAVYTIEPDRKRAIRLAIRMAQPGDIVLIAGKGHEKVQITSKGAQPFDDVEVARTVLQESGYPRSMPASRRTGRTA